VRALTRDPDTDKARWLRDEGVDLVRGDLTDAASLRPALEGITGVFSMATPFESGIEAEIAQGTALGNAAKAVGVRHYVYSSVGGADRRSGVPHFESKWQIEEHLRGLGLPLTIFRPAYFMENLTSYAVQRGDEGLVVSMPLSPTTTLQMIAFDDIGAFVAAAFADPEAWEGKEVELAGDVLTIPDAAERIGRRIGASVTYHQIPVEILRARNKDLALMYEFFEREGYQADLGALREIYPGLKTFDQWLGQGGADLLKAR
jgi:uncharacterized protein YbjT (DUF2867 family)